jgi:hypothetical protein
MKKLKKMKKQEIDGNNILDSYTMILKNWKKKRRLPPENWVHQ